MEKIDPFQSCPIKLKKVVFILPIIDANTESLVVLMNFYPIDLGGLESLSAIISSTSRFSPPSSSNSPPAFHHGKYRHGYAIKRRIRLVDCLDFLDWT